MKPTLLALGQDKCRRIISIVTPIIAITNMRFGALCAP
jgi:hypothetical protein